ncbi:MAG: serine hydrolase domain-containing protein [Hyphomonas sp.]
MQKILLAKYAIPMALALALAACGAADKTGSTETEDEAALEVPVRDVRPAKDSFYGPVLQRLDDDMRRYVDTGMVANISYALIKNGEWVQTGYYGTRTLDGTDPVDEHTIYRIYSMTKAVTAVSLLMLLEEGRFSLDDPITLYLPELEGLKVTRSYGASDGRGLRTVSRPPTMRELLTHTAGFAYGAGRSDYANKVFLERNVEGAKTNEEYLKRIAGVPLMYEPGTAWAYSAASDLQGIIVERLTGERLGTFMKERIFDPLGMVDTGFSVSDEQRARLADFTVWTPGEPLTRVTGPLQDMKAVNFPRDAGGHGLVSTIADYQRFAQMLLQDGSLDGVTLLNPASVNLLRTNGTAFRNPETGFPIHESARGAGFGFGVGVITNTIRSGLGAPEGSYFWDGASGAWFWIDPMHDIVFIGMVQSDPATPVRPRRTAMVDVYHALFTDYFPSRPAVEDGDFN